MLPFLLMTLHFSQIGLTDDLTFTANPPFSIKVLFRYFSKSVQIALYTDTLGKSTYFLFFIKIFYLSLQMILPFVRSYGDISIVTLSPGKILMKFNLEECIR